ncbi:hypothetical protein Tco_0414124 [Tanacetum coccineum]
MMNNKFRGGLLGLKDFKMILRVTAAQLLEEVSAASIDRYLTEHTDGSRTEQKNQLGDMSHHKKIYVSPSHIKKIFANMKREGKDFSGRVTPLFATMMIQATQDKGVDSGIPTDSQQTHITTQHSSLDLRRKRLGEKGGKMNFLKMKNTSWIDSVLDLEKAKDAQAKEIVGLKKMVQKLERKKKSRTTGLKRLRKVSESSRVESSETKESLGTQEDASKQGRINTVDETHGRLDDAKMFDTNDLHCDEVIVDMAVGEKQEKSAKIDEREVSTGVEDSVAPTIPVTTADEGVTAAKIDEITPTSAPTIVIDELTLAQTLIESSKEEKIARKKEEEANIALIESWENTQAMKEADRLLAERLQTREQEELTNKRKAKLFMEFMEKSKKQKTDKNEEVEEDNEAELKMHMVIVKDDDIAIDAIPLATKPPVIVEYKIIKEGIIGHYQLIRADGSSRRYSSMIRML